MKNLTLGQYYPGNSFVHRMDPRGKITALFLFYIFLFMINDNLGYAVAIILGGGMLLLSKVPLKVYWRGSRFIIFFVVLAAAFNIFFTQGTVIWSYAIFEITVEGLYSAAYMAIRLTILILTAFVLTYTTTPLAITDALDDMGKPLLRFNVPVQDIVMIMSIALRFIPVIMDEAEMIKKAQQSRGVDFNFRRPGVWVPNMISLVVPLFVSAFRRSEELALAMEARGYSGTGHRTKFRELKLKVSDVVVMGFFLLLVIAGIIYRWFI